MKVVAIIPERYGSSRFPGKPLADICGKPMVWWVYNRSKSAKKVDDVFVATDDERIANVCKQYDIPYVMTGKHETAPERLQEVSDAIAADFYVGINGDEPLIDPDSIDAAVPEFVPQDKPFGTNVITQMNDPALVMDPSNIKVVFDEDFNALYMSRTPIPYPSEAVDFSYYKHVGVIGYNKKMLDFYKSSDAGMFERIEGIATLRFLDYGHALKFVKMDNLDILSVDTPKDLEVVKSIIQKTGLAKGADDFTDGKGY